MIPANDQQIKTIETFPTFKDFMSQLRPANLIIMYNDINTVEQSLSKDRPTLKDIQIVYTDGRSFYPGIEYLQEWIENLNRFSNINKPLKETQPVAIYLYSKYQHFYLPDLKIIFEKIMRKEEGYGPFYGSVDAQVIIAGFDKYDTIRKEIMDKDRKEQEIEKNRIREEMNKQIQQLFNSTRLIVHKEYHAKYGSDHLNIGRNILEETYRRVESEETKIREEFKKIYGI